MRIPVEQQIRQLQDYVRRGDYSRAYSYMAVQIRGNAIWDQRIVGWLGQAANINRTGLTVNSRLDGSLVKTFVWRMSNLASLEEKGTPLTAAQNQTVSSDLAVNVVNSYIDSLRTGKLFSADQLRALDVGTAVSGLGISNASWSGGVLGVYFGFDMFGFNGTPGVFKSPDEVRTWLSRAKRVMQGILNDTGVVDIGAGDRRCQRPAHRSDRGS